MNIDHIASLLTEDPDILSEVHRPERGGRRRKAARIKARKRMQKKRTEDKRIRSQEEKKERAKLKGEIKDLPKLIGTLKKYQSILKSYGEELEREDLDEDLIDYIKNLRNRADNLIRSGREQIKDLKRRSEQFPDIAKKVDDTLQSREVLLKKEDLPILTAAPPEEEEISEPEEETEQPQEQALDFRETLKDHRIVGPYMKRLDRDGIKYYFDSEDEEGIENFLIVDIKKEDIEENKKAIESLLTFTKALRRYVDVFIEKKVMEEDILGRIIMPIDYALRGEDIEED